MNGSLRRFARWVRGLPPSAYLLRRGVTLEGPPSFQGPWPDIRSRGRLHFGERCVFNTFRLRTRIVVREGAVLKIGQGAYINDGVNICCTRSITIGDHVKIGDMTYIYDTGFHEVSPGSGTGDSGVTIGRNVWIGANCSVLAGSSIGDHSVIGAGSVVTGAIPDRSLAVGCPARVVRTIEAPDDWVRE
jgi:acetyltransferase-like isoleucine patch superfamily enzyme